MIITLLSGRMVDEGNIEFNEDNYHFSENTKQNVLDITDDIKRSDKLYLVPWFDIEKENNRLSSERGHTPGQGLGSKSESTVGIFTEQIFTDPLGAPLDALDKGVKQVFSSTGIRFFLVVGVLVGSVYLYKTLK